MKYIQEELNLPRAAYNAAELAVDVSANIFAARTKKGWTQEKLAKKMGTLQPSIARTENGNTLPSLDFMLRIAKALDTGVVAPTFDSILDEPISQRVISEVHTQTSTPRPLTAYTRMVVTPVGSKVRPNESDAWDEPASFPAPSASYSPLAV